MRRQPYLARVWIAICETSGRTTLRGADTDIAAKDERPRAGQTPVWR